MSRFIVDCSVAMAWHFEEEFDECAMGALQRLKEADALVPRLFYLEAANATLMGARRRGLSQDKSAVFMRLLRSLPIVQDEADVAVVMDRILLLARTHGLTVYAATYLELAERSGLPLATRDEALRRAAERVGVSLVQGVA